MTSLYNIQPGKETSIPTYESIGVPTFINCQGTYTILGGSLPLPEVHRAMEQASHGYVSMDALYDGAGAFLAERMGAEWGLVTSGSAGALCLITASCISGGDPEIMGRLPDCCGLPNRVVTQTAHQHPFEQAVRMAGADIVTVDDYLELQQAADNRTVMLAFLGEASQKGTIGLEEMIAFGKSKRIPVVVDAAAERPDVPNRYLAAGADAVIYSGGKCLRGPQESGIAIGRKDLLKGAFLNGAPHTVLGRPMKVSKESIMGLLAAVEMWYLRDHTAEWKRWERMLSAIEEEIANIRSVTTDTILPATAANVAPRLGIRWDCHDIPLTNVEAKQILENEERIVVPLHGEGISVMPYMMEPGEEIVVGRALRKLFVQAGARRSDTMSTRKPDRRTISVEGDWRMVINFVNRTASHSFTLRADGEKLRGTYYTDYCSAPLEAETEENTVTLRTTLTYEEKTFPYVFSSTVVSEEKMEGTVDMGQFGTAVWAATRLR